MVTYNVHAGSHNFSLKSRDSDSLSALRARVAKKAAIADNVDDLALRYEWHLVQYSLDDEDDWEIFQDRIPNIKEMSLHASHPDIVQPAKQPAPGTRPMLMSDTQSTHSNSAGSAGLVSAMGGGSASTYGVSPNSPTADSQSIYSTYSSFQQAAKNGHKPGKAHSMHMIMSSDTTSNKALSDAGTATKKKKDKDGKSITESIPAHKIAFDAFHNQLGVRTFVGSIGPIENVRMMMKPGHRACYMSRQFAQEHGFIPKDAAPGFYGYAGITNLGNWPVKVGSKTVDLQVMLVENSYFPVILGRSFMEKRGVKTDPLDQTSVVFMDTGEIIPCDIVVVKDSNGNPIPIS